MKPLHASHSSTLTVLKLQGLDTVEFSRFYAWGVIAANVEEYMLHVICIYIYTHIGMCIYIYIYIYREREREGEIQQAEAPPASRGWRERSSAQAAVARAAPAFGRLRKYEGEKKAKQGTSEMNKIANICHLHTN